MGIDPAGVTNIWGSTFGVNLSPVHPTGVCYPSAYGAPNSSSAFLARLGTSGRASLLYLGNEWEVVELGPAAAEIALSCIGNGASFFVNVPLAPNEIVSFFGTDSCQGSNP